jgi:hypothetical protein
VVAAVTGRWLGRWRARGQGVAWPMAVGVLLVPQTLTGQPRVEQRLALALGAYRKGFFLLDLLDVPTRAVDPALGWAPVWDLAARTVADAVIVYGGAKSDVPKPPSRVQGLAVQVLPQESW